jgi:hypothetical protein
MAVLVHRNLGVLFCLLPILLASVACGESGTDHGTPTNAGTGGSNTGTGGATTGTGGSTTGSGGAATGTGGSTTGTGGATTGAGGSSTGSGGATTGTGGSTTGSGGTTGTGGSSNHEPVTCQGHLYACGDGIDNDGDGLVDSDDPDCLGPCHNSESTFYGSIPGQAGPACQVDCYFDQDSGSGNDDCYWDHRCDPHAVAPDYYPESPEGAKCAYDPGFTINPGQLSCAKADQTQSTTCHSVCGPLTPNGCDCFGCCELPANGGKFVWLGSEDAEGNGTCDLASMDDPTKCQPCKPVTDCLNTCEKCELCLGKTTLPPECFENTTSTGAGGSGTTTTGSTGTGGGTTGQCEPSVQACGLPGQGPCESGFYCITGCCQPHL